jgi:hypothetical protein
VLSIELYTAIASFQSQSNPDPHNEFELSAHENALEPPVSLYESIIPTTDPYVPATIINVPITITNTLQTTMAIHRFDLAPSSESLPFAQLSYNHIAPMG